MDTYICKCPNKPAAIGDMCDSCLSDYFQWCYEQQCLAHGEQLIRATIH